MLGSPPHHCRWVKDGGPVFFWRSAPDFFRFLSSSCFSFFLDFVAGGIWRSAAALAPQSVQSVPRSQRVYSHPGPPSSQSPSVTQLQSSMHNLLPQSVQSLPSSQRVYSHPGPPSSQSPSFTQLQSSMHRFPAASHSHVFGYPGVGSPQTPLLHPIDPDAVRSSHRLIL